MTIKRAKNLFLETKLAKKDNKNILILMHLDNCAWCHFVIDEVIAPMSKLKEYTNNLIIRQIEINAGLEMIDFTKQEIANNKFAYNYDVDFYPTLLLFNKNNKLLEKIVGVTNQDFYWTDLDKILEKHYG